MHPTGQNPSVATGSTHSTTAHATIPYALLQRPEACDQPLRCRTLLQHAATQTPDITLSKDLTYNDTVSSLPQGRRTRPPAGYAAGDESLRCPPSPCRPPAGSTHWLRPLKLPCELGIITLAAISPRESTTRRTTLPSSSSLLSHPHHHPDAILMHKQTNNEVYRDITSPRWWLVVNIIDVHSENQKEADGGGAMRYDNCGTATRCRLHLPPSYIRRLPQVH